MTESIVYNEDCMIGMKRFPDKYFDIVVADPPYGINAPKMQMGTNINRKGKGQYPGESTASKLRKGRLNQGAGKLKDRALNTMNYEWDFATPSAEYFSELLRVSKNQIIWGGNYFDLPPTRGIICWDKMQPWENFSQWEMAWTSFDIPAAIFRYSNTGGANRESKIHPTQKPVALYDWLIAKFGKGCKNILDTHVGSGSSRISADKAGLDFTGYEIDHNYWELQEKRFKNHKRQLVMF